jgi:hypothetical protein
MKKFLKWIGIIFFALVGLVVIALAVIYFQTESRLDRVVAAPPDALSIPKGEAAIARGRRIFQFRGCEACHLDCLVLHILLILI